MYSFKGEVIATAAFTIYKKKLQLSVGGNSYRCATEKMLDFSVGKDGDEALSRHFCLSPPAWFPANSIAHRASSSRSKTKKF